VEVVEAVVMGTDLVEQGILPAQVLLKVIMEELVEIMLMLPALKEEAEVVEQEVQEVLQVILMELTEELVLLIQ
jgi:hypothetical protein